MILILEDTLSELNALKEALIGKGISESQFVGFQVAEDARNWFDEQLNKNSPEKLPVLIIADVMQKKGSMIDGRTFVRNCINRLESRGSGAWTFIISRNPDSLADAMEIENVNFTQLKSGDRWAEQIAETAADILSLKFESVEEDDPLAPPLEGLSPKDRIYLFSSPDAYKFSLEQNGLPDYLKPFVTTCEIGKDSAVLMYRGIFSSLNLKYNKVYLTRCLLRWRYLMLKIHRSINAEQNHQGAVRVYMKAIFSWRTSDGWSPEIDKLFFDKDAGMLASIENMIIDFKSNVFYKSIIGSIFRGQHIPTMKNAQIKPNDAFTSESLKALYLNDIPEIPLRRQSKVTDSFMTRLQFVLTDEEVQNFLDWREQVYDLAPQISPNFGKFFNRQL